MKMLVTIQKLRNPKIAKIVSKCSMPKAMV